MEINIYGGTYWSLSIIAIENVTVIPKCYSFIVISIIIGFIRTIWIRIRLIVKLFYYVHNNLVSSIHYSYILVRNKT